MLKAHVETLSFLMIVFLELLTRTGSIPEDLQKAMGEATSVETFLELLNVSDTQNTGQKSSKRNNVAEVPLAIANELCKPVEVMVGVPQPKKRRALIFPVYVKLFRCSGGCNIEPRLSRCTARETQKIPVKVGYVAWRKGESKVSGLEKKVQIIHLVNETECECRCKKVRPCNRKTHIWNTHSCRCEQITVYYRSCSPPQVWNNHSNSCECPKAHICHGSGKVWNREQCKCMCHKSMTCSIGHYLNPKTCQCTCHISWCKHIALQRTVNRLFHKDTIELAKPGKQNS